MSETSPRGRRGGNHSASQVAGARAATGGVLLAGACRREPAASVGSSLPITSLHPTHSARDAEPSHHPVVQKPAEPSTTGAKSVELPSMQVVQSSPAPPAAAVDGWKAEAPEQPASCSGRQRSVTPEDAGQKGAPAAAAAAAGLPVDPSSEDGGGPITPAAAATHAAVSPVSASAPDQAEAAPGPAAAAAAAAVPSAAGTAAAAAQGAADAAAMWGRAQSFMRCVARSALLQSALLSLEVSGTHPAEAAVDGLPAVASLQHTLAQMLVMYLRAGYTHAREDSLLAALWVLESTDCVWRSPATVCLNDYLKHLAVFSEEAVVALTADWSNSFRTLRAALVAAQMDLLKRMDWRVLLDGTKEVKPCHELLFKLPRTNRQQAVAACATTSTSAANTAPVAAEASASAAAALQASPREPWTRLMRNLCGNIRRQAALLNQPDPLAFHPHSDQEDEGEEAGQGPRHIAKRRRTMLQE